MKKIFRVFYSQIFNAFFPILIILILIKISGNADISTILLLMNYSNFYLLFTDYSSNIVFLKEALQNGGINANTDLSITQNINIYLGIKFLFLSTGFFIWILLCYVAPALHKHFLEAVLSYTFIIGYNLNFYWVYMSSKKEFYFIISNLFARLTLLISLLIFIFFQFNFIWLMPIVGVLNIVVCLLFFKKFCKIFSLQIYLNNQILKQSTVVIGRDFAVMVNNFLLLSPTTFLSIFVGFIKNLEHLKIYSLAEKIFLALRALLAIFTNSLYPVFCEPDSISKNRKRSIFIIFYATVITGCALIYFTSPFVISMFNLPISNFALFHQCLLYFLITIVITSINSPFMLWLLVHNFINTKKAFAYLVTASIIIFILFFINSLFYNGVITIAKSVLASESIIVAALILLYKFRKRNSAQ